MKVKATINFAGKISMKKGEVREVDEAIASPLLSCGYLKKVTNNKRAVKPDVSESIND